MIAGPQRDSQRSWLRFMCLRLEVSEPFLQPSGLMRISLSNPGQMTRYKFSAQVLGDRTFISAPLVFPQPEQKSRACQALPPQQCATFPTAVIVAVSQICRLCPTPSKMTVTNNDSFLGMFTGRRQRELLLRFNQAPGLNRPGTELQNSRYLVWLLPPTCMPTQDAVTGHGLITCCLGLPTFS